MQKKQFYRDFAGSAYNGIGQNIQIDTIGAASVIVFNSSLAGQIFVGGSWILEAGTGFEFKGSENQILAGKIDITLTNFFANIDYRYTVIIKRFI